LILSRTAGSFAESNPPVPAAPVVQPTHAASASDRNSYLEIQKTKIEQWRRRIADFNERVETKTTHAGQAAKVEIEGAWGDVEQASDTLDVTGEGGWAAAKAAYERASATWEATWAKFDPARK
jgi:hypothetical protein